MYSFKFTQLTFIHQDRNVLKKFLILSPLQSFSHAMLTHTHADVHENALIQNPALQCHREGEAHIEDLGHPHFYAVLGLCWAYSYLSNPGE